MKELGLYIHIPFCARKCAYCDFCSFDSLTDRERDGYVNALIREIEAFADCAREYSVRSVFFGGGTPSLLNEKQLSRIFSALSLYPLADGAEISMEINPKTVDRRKLTFIKKCGVNRLSIGMQSARDDELLMLGRLHSRDDFLTCYRTAREVGFDNINVDVMTALPGQSIEALDETLDFVISLFPEHISAYILKIEENTPFAKRRIKSPDEDFAADIYLHTCEYLENAGYSHYEISNFSLKGRECRHNLGYWRLDGYLGFGVSASSLFDGERYTHTRNFAAYLDFADTEPTAEQYISNEKITEREGSVDTPSEYIMLSLRLSDGISLKKASELLGYDFITHFSDIIEKTVAAGLAVCESGRYFLTDRGMCVSNSVICEFLLRIS